MQVPDKLPQFGTQDRLQTVHERNEGEKLLHGIFCITYLLAISPGCLGGTFHMAMNLSTLLPAQKPLNNSFPVPVEIQVPGDVSRTSSISFSTRKPQ